MPNDGQMGTANDGTPVVWSARANAAIPLGSPQAKQIWPQGLPGAPRAAPKPFDPDKNPTTKALNDAANTADGASDLAHAFQMKNRDTATGGYLGIPFAEAISKAMPWGDPNLQSMDQDSNELALAMRKPGMRMTQMEFGKFLGSVPSTHSAPGQNNNSVDQIAKLNTLAQAKAAFFSKWGSVRGSLDGAQPAWLNYKAQHFGPDGSFIPDKPAPPAGRAGANAALQAQSGRSGPVLLGYE